MQTLSSRTFCTIELGGCKSNYPNRIEFNSNRVRRVRRGDDTRRKSYTPRSALSVRCHDSPPPSRANKLKWLNRKRKRHRSLWPLNRFTLSSPSALPPSHRIRVSRLFCLSPCDLPTLRALSHFRPIHLLARFYPVSTLISGQRNLPSHSAVTSGTGIAAQRSDSWTVLP